MPPDFMYALFTAVVAVLCLVEYRRHGLTLPFFCYVWIAIIYGAVPTAITSGCEGCVNPRFALADDPGLNTPALMLIAVAFLTFVAAIGVSRRGVAFTDFYTRGAPIHRSVEQRFVLIFFVVGLATFSLFIQMYGGLEYVLQNISRIRSGSDDNKNYFAAFLQMFHVYILVALSYFYILNFSRKPKIFHIILFLFVVFSSFFATYLIGGRQRMINILIILLVSHQFTGRKLGFLWICLAGVIMLTIILFGKTFLFQIWNPEFDVPLSEVAVDGVDRAVAARLVLEFSHQYLSLINALSYSDWDFRAFGDYWYWAVKWLKLLGVEAPDSISYFNTFIIHGAWDSEIPPGIVAFGYLSYGTWGVVIHSALTGLFIGLIERFYRFLGRTELTATFYVMACVFCPYLIWNSDPALFVQVNLAIMLMFGIYVVAHIAPNPTTLRQKGHPSLSINHDTF